MSLKRITLSGIDETIDPKWLVEISDEHKEEIDIEWGILLSRKNGRERYPGFKWLEELEEIASQKELKLSGHLCGQYVKSLIANEPIGISINMEMFDRIQINLAPYFDRIDADLLAESINNNLSKYYSYILQAGSEVEGTNNIAIYLNKLLIKTGILFDCSGGNGVEPASWPSPLPQLICGYAGGINPNNISEKIYEISNVAGNSNFWIDMETGIRTNNITDKEKIISVIEIAKRFICC